MIGWIRRVYKRLVCAHETGYFRRNIYGDEINYANARSVYQCCNCGKYIYKGSLNKTKEGRSLDFLHMVEPFPLDVQADLINQAGLSRSELVTDYENNRKTEYQLNTFN